MKALCIDAKHHDELYNPIDLTYMNTYELGEICGCGKHILVTKDDMGDEADHYIDRFVPVSDIDGVEILNYELKTELV